MQPCPSLQSWQDFLLGKLADAEIGAAETHLSHCTACTSLVASLESSSDSVVAAVRHCGDSAAGSDAELNALIASVAGESSALLDAAEEELTGSSLGQYELLQKLGEGGMGQVYLARHRKLKRHVAVKVIATQRLHSAAALARFHREMEAAGRLDHPHLARALDAGDDRGRHFLVMEYIAGANVSQLVRRGTLAVADACEIIRQAALGLAHAHEAGLIHRDVKPSNLMLSSAGVVKLLDVGLAQITSADREGAGELDATRSGAGGADLTHAGQIVGSPDYMAPEQCQPHGPADARSDIYALGCTFFHLLTGRPPFAEPPFLTIDQKLAAHRESSPAGVRQWRPDVPAEVEALLARMLTKSPEDRPQTATEVACALQSWTKGANLPGMLSPQPTSARDTAAPARNRRTALLIASLTLLVAALVIAGIALGPRFRRAAQQPVPEKKLPKDRPVEQPPVKPVPAATPSYVERTRTHALESQQVFLTRTLNDRMLLVDGRSLRVLDATGTEVKTQIRWERPYHAIYERPAYYVGLAERAVHLINKNNGETMSIVTFPASPLHALIIHPRQAKSYVSLESKSKGNIVVEIDEAAVAVKELPGVSGMSIAINAEGTRLFTAAEEMIAYDLTAAPPTVLSRHDQPGQPGVRLRIAPDGRTLSFAAGRIVAAVETADLDREAAHYETAGDARDIAYHPVLDLVACAHSSGIAWFERSTGRPSTSRLKGEATFTEIRQICFSPDGAHLLVEQGDPASERQVTVLDVQLTDAERAAIADATKR